MGTEALRAVLLLAHLSAAATWLGGMVYSLAIVQPRARRVLASADRYEGLAVAVGAGARRGVLALIGLLAASGAGLVAVEIAGARDPGALWAVLVAVKAVLLMAATTVFAHVSWRLWPARLFALPAEARGAAGPVPGDGARAHRARRRGVRARRRGRGAPMRSHEPPARSVDPS